MNVSHLQAGCATVALLVVGLEYCLNASSTRVPESKIRHKFREFQHNYCFWFLVAMGSDWIQGPYLYKIYEDLGLNQYEIAILFISGYVSAAIFGFFVGAATDRFGRKKGCIAYCVFYILSAITKHFVNFYIALFGRIVSGFATALLFSAFESWMCAEHSKRKYPVDLLGYTFTLAWKWNFPVAILAGIVANYVYNYFGSSVAVFDCQIVLLLCLLCGIQSWEDNHGVGTNMCLSISKATRKVLYDFDILRLCVCQTLFEGSMYVFVFLWSPTLDTIGHKGWVFALFMCSCMLGSQLMKAVQIASLPRHYVSAVNYFIASLTFSSLPYVTSQETKLMLFCIFEVTVGIHFPSQSYFRSLLIDDHLRTTITCLCRLPVNLVVIVVILNVENFERNDIFQLVGFLCILASICSIFIRVPVDGKDSGDPELKENSPEEEVQGFLQK